MGALVTKALRPIKSFNIENRAHRVISKEKPVPAPKYPSNLEDVRRAMELEPDLDEKLEKKDVALDDRLKNVYVTSKGRPEDDITREAMSSGRLLPQDRKLLPDYDFGFKEPEQVKYGRTTLRSAMDFISSHQANPTEVTAEKIALEYKLKEEDVKNILKYFKTFEVYVPKTKSSPATFAGPAAIRHGKQPVYKVLEGNGDKTDNLLDDDKTKQKS